MDTEKMMQAMQSVQVDEQSIENLATIAAEDIVQIDMTTPEYTADTCPMASPSPDMSHVNQSPDMTTPNMSTLGMDSMPSVLDRDL